jgi:Na+-transporting NADH:ubiquinone oxidoreductase subunit NqrB
VRSIAWPRDARVYQILFLATLLATGALLRDFSLKPEQMLFTFAAGVATQFACIRFLKLREVGFLSAVITCFGLSILLRADSLWVHPLAAMLAIGGKFFIRVNGKHLFNPANLGVMAGLLLLPGAWVSSGQWGSDLAYAAWFVALGSVVTNRARRMDISWCFLACFLGLVACRVLWLEQSWAIFFHQLQSGALLLFTFFMISDPMTIPNRAGARFLYAAIVAGIAFFWQFYLFKPNGLIWALFVAAPLVPLFDRLMPGSKFQWVPNHAPLRGPAGPQAR